MIYVLAVLLLTSFALLHVQTRTHAKQVADLCQRLQAPETAVAQHVIAEQHYKPAHLPYDDDGAFMKYVESLVD